MVRICIRMLQIPLEWLEFAFECFKSCSNAKSLHTHASNTFLNLNSNAFEPMIQIYIQMLQIWSEGFEFAFECFDSLSSGANLHSNASNRENLHSKSSTPYRMVRIYIWILRMPFEWLEFKMLQIPLEWLEFAFECFESHSKGLEFPYESFEFGLNG